MQIETNGFALGDVARDKITGYEGEIIGITQWTTGCARAVLQMKIGKRSADGKIPDSATADVLTLELVTAGPNHEAEPPKRKMPSGGPMPAPTRRRDATR